MGATAHALPLPTPPPPPQASCNHAAEGRELLRAGHWPSPALIHRVGGPKPLRDAGRAGILEPIFPLMLTSSYNIFLISVDFIHFEIYKIQSFILSFPECKLTSCTVWWVLYSSSLRRRCWNFSLCFAIQIS